MSEYSVCADCGGGTKSPKLRETGAGAVEVCGPCHRDYEREYNSRKKVPQDRANNSARRPGV